MSTATKGKRPAAPPRRPEKKYGPFHGGVGLAVWLNQVDGENGPRYFRSCSLAPRRYRDKKTGEWMDAGSLRATDLPAIILAMEAALVFMNSTPLPGEPVEEDVLDAMDAREDEVPL
jgi:hypothetical protein